MGIEDLIKEQNKKNIFNKNINPLEIFENLSKEVGYEYLRNNQEEFLKKWFERKEEKNIVGILNTGAGKTLIGLLMLLSKMYEKDEPALYLCPDNQLVDQVVEQSKMYGIKVVQINEKNEIPDEFINSESILITTFEKLFNGKSIFGIDGIKNNHEIPQIGVLLIDDAHSCIKKARKQTTVNIKSNTEYYNRLFELFSKSLEEQSIARFNAIKNKEISVLQKVPYWTWKENINEIRNIVIEMNNKKDPNVIFVYNLIIDELEKCQCFISGTEISIVPYKIPIHKIRAYHKAEYKFIMSATFNNYYDLISELGINKEAVRNSIRIEKKSDIGEKLIIIPERYHIDFTKKNFEKLLKNYTEKKGNIVVLVPNSFKANEWEAMGAKIINESINEEIKKLSKENIGNFYVIKNRYDGIDLSGKSCNLLIIDGLPAVNTTEEQALNIMIPNSNKNLLQKAQIIEQALGRSVRSGSDYSIVLLFGDELKKFIMNKKNIKFLSKQTQIQLELSLKLLEDKKNSKKEAAEEIVKQMKLVLSRNENWKKFYKEYLKDRMEDKKEISFDKKLLDLVDIENEVFKLYRQSKHMEAYKKINEILEKIELSPEESALYYQYAAEILYDINKTKSNDLQIKAYEENELLLKPISPNKKKKTIKKDMQVERSLENINSYISKIDLYNRIEKICLKLNYPLENESLRENYDNERMKKESDEFENAVEELGEILGFLSSRPEKEKNDGGSDNLWRTSSYSYIIECKNMVSNGKIDKKELGQISQSMNWYKNNTFDESEKYCGIFFHPSNTLNKQASKVENVFVVNKDKLEKLKNKLQEMINEIVNNNKDELEIQEIKEILERYNFLGKKFKDNYTVELKKE